MDHKTRILKQMYERSRLVMNCVQCKKPHLSTGGRVVDQKQLNYFEPIPVALGVRLNKRITCFSKGGV